jgi:hypothetical protein
MAHVNCVTSKTVFFRTEQGTVIVLLPDEHKAFADNQPLCLRYGVSGGCQVLCVFHIHCV